MADRKQLGKKQLAVIEDMFRGELDEQAILDKHKISKNIYNKWLTDENFIEEFNRRIAWLNRQSELIIARYASLAAAKLVQLTESEKAETARKACLDIISLPKPALSNSQKATVEPQTKQLSQATCGRLLAALANEKTE